MKKMSKMADLHFFSREQLVKSSTYSNCRMHFMLSEHDRPNAIELDLSIFEDKYFTAAAHFQVESEPQKSIFGILYFFSISKIEQ